MKTTRNESLAARLNELFLHGHWIANTNYQEQLSPMDWQVALVKIEGLNSIAALTYHINYYLSGLLSAFASGTLSISDRFSFDLPKIQSQAEWNNLVDELMTNAASFAQKVADMDDAIFDQVFIEERYGSYLRNIEAVLEHSYYHLGQIVILKKLVSQQNNLTK